MSTPGGYADGDFLQVTDNKPKSIPATIYSSPGNLLALLHEERQRIANWEPIIENSYGCTIDEFLTDEDNYDRDWKDDIVQTRKRIGVLEQQIIDSMKQP